MYTGPGNDRRELFHEFQGREDQGSRAIGVFAFKFVTDLAGIEDPQTLLGNRRAGDVSAEFLKFFSLPRGAVYACMKRKPLDGSAQRGFGFRVLVYDLSQGPQASDRMSFSLADGDFRLDGCGLECWQNLITSTIIRGKIWGVVAEVAVTL